MDREDRADGVQGQIGDSGLLTALAEAQAWARRWEHLAELQDIVAAIAAYQVGADPDARKDR